MSLIVHLDGGVRIWHKQHEIMDSSCHVSALQAVAVGVMVWIVTKLKSVQTGFFSSLYSDGLHRSQPNRASLGCRVKGDLSHGCATDKCAATL